MAVLQQVPVERINAQARELDPARVLLTLLAAPLFVLGWATAKVVRAVWIAFAWTWTAARVGWQEGWNSQRAEGG